MPIKRSDDELFESQEGSYFIPVTSSYVDDRVRILNSGDTFGVFNRVGDLQRLGNDVFGLYHSGTRFLQKFEMRINGIRPVLLSSHIKDSNDILSVDTINPDLYENGELVVPKGTVHIFRSKFIQNDVCYESIALRNFGERCDIMLTFSLESDFCDIFEVRGIARSERGTVFEPRVHDGNKLLLEYVGLDSVTRSTDVVFSRPFERLEDGKLAFKIHLEKGERQNLGVEIHFHVEEKKAISQVTFDQAEKDIRKVIGLRNSLFSQIETSNEQFNHWLNRSKADLISLLADTTYGQYPYAGVPWYNTAFGRDGLITARQLLWIAPEIAKGVLNFAANMQAKAIDTFSDAEPGKIFHETRNGEMANLGEIPFKLYYGTIDATPLFVCLAGSYFLRTGDKETITALWPNIKLALKWIEEFGDQDKDGFVEYIHKSDKGLTNQGWKDSHDCVFHSDGALAEAPIALCEVQGYVYEAKRLAAIMATHLGDHEMAKQLDKEATELAERFHAKFWDDGLQNFALALDKNKKRCQIQTSNTGHCLFSGIVKPSVAPLMVKSLFSESMNSGWGIRTLSCHEVRYNPMSYHNGSIWPHDNSLIALGLNRYGFKDETLNIMQSLFDASLTFSDQRLPELFCGFDRRKGEGPAHYPVACSPQAWAVGSVFACVQAAIGIEIDYFSKTVKFNKPTLPQYIDSLSIDALQLGQSKCSLFLIRHKNDVGISVENKPDDWSILVQK